MCVAMSAEERRPPEKEVGVEKGGEEQAKEEKDKQQYLDPAAVSRVGVGVAS